MALVFSVGSEIFWRYCENHLRSWYRFCKVLFLTTGKASQDHNTGAVASMNLELSLDFESKQERSKASVKHNLLAKEKVFSKTHFFKSGFPKFPTTAIHMSLVFFYIR